MTVPDHIESALAKFKKRLSKDELKEFEKTTFKDVIDELDRVQREQEQFKNMVNMARIQTFLNAIEQYGKIVEVFLNASRIVCFIWGPIKFIVQTSSSFLDSFESFLDAYEEIGHNLPLVDSYKDLAGLGPVAERGFQAIYLDILEFHKSAMRFCQGSVWKRLFRSTWKDYSPQFKATVDRIYRHRTLIESQANARHHREARDHMSLSQNHMTLSEDHLQLSQQHFNDTQQQFEFVHEHFALSHQQSQEQMRQSQEQLQEQLRNYQKEIEEINHKWEKKRQEDQEKKILAVTEWLAAADYQTLHDSFLAERQKYPTTGGWILERDAIRKWKDDKEPETPVAWLHGMPGAGKTILASVIIEECKKNPSFSTSYYYCKEGNPEMNHALAVYKGLLRQIIAQHPHLLPHAYEKRLSNSDPLLRSQLLAKQMLETFCADIDYQYFIIDGLDECEVGERKEILKFFVKLAETCELQKPGKLRVLFSSQDQAEIRKILNDSKTRPSIFSLNPDHNKDDITYFVKNWVGKIREKHDINEVQQEYIECTIVSKARGMFLYAKLVSINLHAQPTRDQLLEEINLQRFPDGLEEAYQRIMKRIHRNATREEWKAAKKLLGWMVCAKRPLSWIEMQVAMSMNPETQDIEFDDKKLRVHIHDICGSLIQILPGDRVELVHSTAKTYLVSETTGYIHEPSVECDLAILCLQYLIFDCFDKIEHDKEETLLQFAIRGHLAFEDYAVAKWHHHVNAVVRLGEKLRDERWTDRLEKFNEAMDDFFTRYEDEKWHDAEQIIPKSEKACQAYEDTELYDNLRAIWSHIYRHDVSGFESRNEVSIKALAEALKRNRKFLENPPAVLAREQKEKLKEFYGQKPYKCRKITCIYFYEGFKDSKSRDKHINRHDRPFPCEDDNCLYAESGFGSNKELESHYRSYHPELSKLATSFKSTLKKAVVSKWNCAICDKNFTRHFHLKNHIKSHNGERPHACPECGKAFTRLNDCKRHQKLHERR